MQLTLRSGILQMIYIVIGDLLPLDKYESIIGNERGNLLIIAARRGAFGGYVGALWGIAA